MKEHVFMRLVSAFFGIWFALVVIGLSGCTAWNYINKNCRIESQVSGESFVCVICNFDNASESLRKRIEKRIDEIGRPGR